MVNTKTLKSDSYDGRYMQLVCEQTKDVANNKSVIKWTLSSVGGDDNYYSTGPTSVYINAQLVYYKDRVNWDAKVFPAAEGEESGEIEVTHNEDGTKGIPVLMNTVIYKGSGSVKAYSGWWELDPIPRGATLLSAPESFDDTMLPTVTYSNPRRNDVDSLQICIADSRGSDGVADYRDLDKTGSSYTFTDDDIDKLRHYTAGAPKRNGTFVIRTIINGEEYHDSLPFTFEVTEGELTKPSVTMAITADNSSIPSSLQTPLAGKYVQGRSKVRANITAVGKYGATFNSFALRAGSVGNFFYYTEPLTVASVSSDAIADPGEVEVVGKATDSRGFTGETKQGITVLAYSKPSIAPLGSATAIQCYRSNDEGTYKGNSDKVWLKVKKSHSALGGANGCTLEWRCKLSKDAWNDNTHKWTALIPKTTTAAVEYDTFVGGTFLVNESYTAQIKAVDDFGEYDIKDLEIPTQDVALHLGDGGKNVTIGDYCDTSKPHTFRSAWDAYFEGNVYRKAEDSEEWVLEDGIVEQGSSGIWTYRKWRSGKVECWGEYAFKPSSTGNNALTVEYPFPMMTIPIVQLTPSTNGNLCSYVHNCDASGNNNNRNTQLSMLVCGVTNASYVIGINVYVISSWK